MEIVVVDNTLHYFSKIANRTLKPQRRRSLFPIVQRAKVTYKPHGVAGFITPWNYPYLLVFIDVIPALIAGNTVIVKPSEITPLCCQYAIQLMHQVGIPSDVAQMVTGDGSTGAALVEFVDFISFTGSTHVGRKVAMRAAERLIPFSLELGGNDPSIVLKDADLDMTAAGLVRGAFENSGQACVSVERVYVDETIYDPLIAKVKEYGAKFLVGSGRDMDIHMGSLTNLNELERTEAHIQDAVARGATVIMGGQRRPDLGNLFFEPTILVDVDHSMDIVQQETFGPVLPIMKVKDEAEALRLANQSNYGLSASVFGKDLRHAEAIAQQIDSGDVSINRTHIGIGTPSVPSGGQKESGLGTTEWQARLIKIRRSAIDYCGHHVRAET